MPETFVPATPMVPKPLTPSVKTGDDTASLWLTGFILLNSAGVVTVLLGIGNNKHKKI